MANVYYVFNKVNPEEYIQRNKSNSYTLTGSAIEGEPNP